MNVELIHDSLANNLDALTDSQYPDQGHIIRFNNLLDCADMMQEAGPGSCPELVINSALFGDVVTYKFTRHSVRTANSVIITATIPQVFLEANNWKQVATHINQHLTGEVRAEHGSSTEYLLKKRVERTLLYGPAFAEIGALRYDLELSVDVALTNYAWRFQSKLDEETKDYKFEDETVGAWASRLTFMRLAHFVNNKKEYRGRAQTHHRSEIPVETRLGIMAAATVYEGVDGSLVENELAQLLSVLALGNDELKGQLGRISNEAEGYGGDCEEELKEVFQV